MIWPPLERFELSTNDFQECVLEGQRRHRVNKSERGIGDKIRHDDHASRTLDWWIRQDIVGCIGEKAVARAFGYKEHRFVDRQHADYTRFHDLFNYEVKATEYWTGNLVVGPKELKHTQPIILVTTRILDVSHTAACALRGWVTGEQAQKRGEEKLGGKQFSWWVAQEMLNPMSMIPKPVWHDLVEV